MSWPCRSCAGDNPDGTRFCGHCGAPASSALLDQAPAARLPEQLRFVTAMFADLSGFTSLSEQLDPETLSEIIGAAIHAMSAVVDRYGGTVLNYAGDAVLAGFGIPESAGDDAERALAAALDMRQALVDLLPSLPPIAAGLTMHIGVNSGHAVARYTGASTHVAYTIVGDAVNTAQRLEAAAPSGEIFIGPLTAELAGHLFVLEPVGPIVMKGKAEPMPAWRLIARRDHAVRSRTMRAGGIVGREDVLADLAAVPTTRRVVALVGEPGVGKTATVQQAAAEMTGVRWVMASAVPYLSEPYGLWRSITRALAGDDSVLDSILGADDVQDDPEAPAIRQRAAHRAVFESVRAAAPVVVVLDDIQWADPASLDLAREFAFELGLPGSEAGIGLVITARPEGLDAARLLLDEVPGPAGALHGLEGLDAGRMAVLTAGVLGGVPTDALAALVAERTGGSPFFATELVRLLVEQGRVVATDGGWDLATDPSDPGIPPTVEELVQGRLDRLEPGPRAVLEVAAVIGPTVSLALLRSAAPSAAGSLMVDPLVGAGLLVRNDADPSTVAFRHGIVRDVAYQCTLRGTRRRLHADVADAIETLPDAGDRLNDLAQHLYLADAGVRAVDALERAAGQAARLFANASAVELLDQAVEVAVRHAVDDRTVWDLRLRRANLNAVQSRSEAALGEFRELAEAVAPDRRDAALLGVALALGATARFDEALDVLDEMSSSANADRAAVRTSTLLSAGRLTEAADEATTALGRGCDAAIRVRLLALRAQALDSLGRTAEALSDAVEAGDLAPTCDDRGAQLLALRVLGGMYVDHDRLDDAERTLRAGVELANAGGRTIELASCLVSLAFLEQRRGNIARAIDLDRQCVREFHRIRHGFEGGALANLAHKLADAGELSEAGDVAQQAATVATRLGDALALADARYAAGRVAGELGEFEAARAELRAALDLLREIGTTSMVDEIEALLERWSAASGLSRGDRQGLRPSEHDSGLTESGDHEVSEP